MQNGKLAAAHGELTALRVRESFCIKIQIIDRPRQLVIYYTNSSEADVDRKGDCMNDRFGCGAQKAGASRQSCEYSKEKDDSSDEQDKS